MNFLALLSSKKFLISAALITAAALALTAFPLVGVLGFEYSVFTAFVLAFLSVFLSAELIALDYTKGPKGQNRFSDLMSMVLSLHLILLAIPFLVGLGSSVIRSDCYISEGVVFYLLIPLVTVFFSCSLGMFLGTVFPRRGFLIGALVLIGTVLYSLWNLYRELPVYAYNPVFGFFPGPLYDEVIPITKALIMYRALIVCWGLSFLTALGLYRRVKFGILRAWEAVVLVVLIAVLVAGYVKREELGFQYTRDYVVENYLVGSVETKHFIIYFTPGTREARDIALIANDHEWRYRQLADFMKVGSEEKIRSYIYPDSKTRKKLLGSGAVTVANPIHREIHLVYDSFPHDVLKHELAHVMASEFGTRVLRVSPKVGLVEGLAVAADWGGEAHDPHQWSAALHDIGAAPDITEVLGYGFWVKAPSRSYTVMGSFSRFLIDTYGIQRYKRFYRSGDASVYGKALDELVGQWREFLGAISVPEGLRQLALYKFSQPSIFEGKCPRKISALREKAILEFKNRNYYRARSYVDSALRHSPDDPSLLQILSYTYYYGGDFDSLLAMDAQRESLTKVDRAVIENLRANALWQLGDAQKALELYRSLHKLGYPPDLQRSIELKINSIEIGGGIEEKMREYFSTRDKVTQVAVLSDLVRENPDYGGGFYLLGKIFYSNGEYKRAKGYLSRSVRLGLPTGKLFRESLMLLGLSSFADGDYADATAGFERVLKLGADRRLTESARDFIDRSKWSVSSEAWKIKDG
ncbi:MAG: hypothetical protein IH874_05590 [Candidatus Dadabacteria bacterium]|nr:hypothetical protein [Candidatus Dadabacteria bacterium]